jgi:hypothetical protein
MRLTDADRARETAQELVELLVTYDEKLKAWEAVAPAVAGLREAVCVALVEAGELICEADRGAVAAPRARVH